MTETDVTDLEEIEQGLKACGLQEKETDKEGSNIDGTPKGAVDMPTTKRRISRGDFDKMKEHLKKDCSDFPKTTEYVEEVLEAFIESIRRKKENEHDTVIQSLTLEGDTQKKLKSMGFKGKIYHKKQSIHSPMPYFVKELVSEESREEIVTESASSSFIIVFYRIVNDTPVIFLLPTAQNWQYVNEIACESFPNQIDSKMMTDEFINRELIDISGSPLKATVQHTESGRVLPRGNTNSNEIEGKVETPVAEEYRDDLDIPNLRFQKDKKAIKVKGNLSFSDILNVLVKFSQIWSEYDKWLKRC